MKILSVFPRNRLAKRCTHDIIFQRRMSTGYFENIKRFEKNVGAHDKLFKSRNAPSYKQSGYTFSKQRLTYQESYLLRRYCVWARNSRYVETNPTHKNLEALKKSYGYFEIIRKTSDSSIQDQKTPIKEPNIPEKNIKKDDNKKEKKDKKPVMILSGNTSSNQATIEEIRKVFHNKWGVKLLDNAKVTNEINSPKVNTTPTTPTKTESNEVKKSNKLRLALITSIDEPMENYFVKRPPRKTNLEKGPILYMDVADESTEADDEYYVPPELQEKGEVAAWKRTASNSKRRTPKDDETTPAAKLQDVESIFIRPEPPEPKMDVKSSFYTQKSHFSTFKDSKSNEDSIDRGSAPKDGIKSLTLTTDKRNKSSHFLINILSWFSESKTDTNKLPVSKDKNASNDEIIGLIEKPDIVNASKLPCELDKNCHERFKLERLNSIKAEELESIYQLKNYDSFKIDKIKDSKLVAVPLYETEKSDLESRIEQEKKEVIKHDEGK